MSMDPQEHTTLALIVALVAATAGPLATMAIGRMQARTHAAQLRQQSQQFREELNAATSRAKQAVISPMRQAWIEKLRNTVAEALAQASLLRLKSAPLTSEERLELASSGAKLELLINPNEEEHQDLLKAVNLVINSIDDVPTDEFFNARRDAVSKAQRVLKLEWEVTKRGET